MRDVSLRPSDNSPHLFNFVYLYTVLSTLCAFVIRHPQSSGSLLQLFPRCLGKVNLLKDDRRAVGFESRHQDRAPFLLTPVWSSQRAARYSLAALAPSGQI